MSTRVGRALSIDACSKAIAPLRFRHVLNAVHCLSPNEVWVRVSICIFLSLALFSQSVASAETPLRRTPVAFIAAMKCNCGWDNPTGVYGLRRHHESSGSAACKLDPPHTSSHKKRKRATAARPAAPRLPDEGAQVHRAALPRSLGGAGPYRAADVVFKEMAPPNSPSNPPNLAMHDTEEAPGSAVLQAGTAGQDADGDVAMADVEGAGSSEDSESSAESSDDDSYVSEEAPPSKLTPEDEAEIVESIDALRFGETEVRGAIASLLVQLGKGKGKKLVDQLIKLMFFPCFVEKDVPGLMREAGFLSVDAIKEKLEEMIVEEIKEAGFVEETCPNEFIEGEYVKYWRKNPVKVIKDQLEHIDLKKGNCYTEPFHGKNHEGKEAVTHPMSGKIGLESVTEVKRRLQTRHPLDTVVNKEGVYWSEEAGLQRGKSMIALLQCYSDAAVTTLSTRALGFHAVHATVSNFTSEVKDELVTKGLTMIAYASTAE